MATKTYTGAHDFSGATLTGIGSQTYDAVVASSGGDYTTIADAITAGAKTIFVKAGTYTSFPATITTTGLTIIGESRDLVVFDISASVSINAAEVILKNLRFVNDVATTQFQINETNCYIDNCDFTSNHNANPGAAYGVVTITSLGTYLKMTNCKIRTRTGTTAQANRIGLYCPAAVDGCFINNLYIDCNSNTTQSPGFSVNFANSVLSNLVIDKAGTSVGSFAGDNFCVNNVTTLNEGASAQITFGTVLNKAVFSNFNCGTVNFVVYDSDFCKFMNIRTEGSLTFNATYPSDHTQWTNFDFVGGVTLNAGSDYNIFMNGKVGADAGGGGNTITLAASANNNMIIGCMTDAAISDSGTGNLTTSNGTY